MPIWEKPHFMGRQNGQGGRSRQGPVPPTLSGFFAVGGRSGVYLLSAIQLTNS
jgi:hypothetical protein